MVNLIRFQLDCKFMIYVRTDFVADASTLGISSEQWQPRSGDMLGIRCAGIRAAACQTGAHSVNFVCLVHDVHVLLGSLSC